MAGRSCVESTGFGLVSSSGRFETEFVGDIGFATDAGGLGCALEGIEVTTVVVPGALLALLLLSYSQKRSALGQLLRALHALTNALARAAFAALSLSSMIVICSVCA